MSPNHQMILNAECNIVSKVHRFGLPGKRAVVKKCIVGKELHCVTFIFNLFIVISRMVATPPPAGGVDPPTNVSKKRA